MHDPERWSVLIEQLLKHTRVETEWSVVCLGIFHYLRKLPKSDPRWIEPFLDAYIYLAIKSEKDIAPDAYTNLWSLILNGLIDKQHPKFSIIVQLAEQGMNLDDDSIRVDCLAILDWVEDSG